MRNRRAWSPTDAAVRAVARARSELATDYPELIGGVFHYGAVDIDTKHLVVWVLLTLSADALPPWCVYLEPPAGDSIALDLRSKLIEMQATVRRHLAREGWPDSDHVTVGFESDERVRAGGGWAYFK
jgi:hypothetical protein